MYRIVWVLPRSDSGYGELIEDVFPQHAEALAREGCWKLIAGEMPAEHGGVVVELWTDSATTADGLLASDAAASFRSALERQSGSIEEARGAADEVVTLHISALRMG